MKTNLSLVDAKVAISIVLCLSAAGSARSDDRPGAASKTARRITAEPFCGATETKLFVHTIVDERYTFSDESAKVLGEETHDTRALWSLSCDLRTKDCRGFRFDLSSIQTSNHIQFTDSINIEDARIVSAAGKVYVIKWGPMRTITVDLAEASVTVRESSASSEGGGRGSC